MEGVSFSTRSFQVVDGPGGVPTVLLGAIVTVADARALADAASWWRSAEYLAPRIEDAEAVLALRSVVELLDQFEALAAGDHAGPVTLARRQVALLAEVVARYLSERDGDDYQAPAERERIGRLRALRDPLFDLVAAFAGAEAELHAYQHRD
jgi:hypothetical protein